MGGAYGGMHPGYPMMGNPMAAMNPMHHTPLSIALFPGMGEGKA